MADVTVTDPDEHHHGSTPAGGADRIDFGADVTTVEIIHRAGSDGLWWTVGGQGADDPPVPAAADGQARYLAPGTSVRVQPETGEKTRVRVFAASVVEYSVEVEA